jgi:Uma2 family endonuclease
MDTTINLGGQEGPRPDVFVIDRERWIASDTHGGYPLGSPQLVIEVKSESNSWREMSSKKELFLKDENCLSVWIVDPERRRIHVYDRTNAIILEAEDVLAIPNTLGNGSWKVKEVFDGIISR